MDPRLRLVQTFNAEMYERDVERVAADTLHIPPASGTFVPFELMLPKISVRTFENRRRSREVFFLGQFTLTSVLGLRQHIEEDIELKDDRIMRTNLRKTWLESTGNLFIPDSSLRLDDLTVSISPNASSSTGYVLRSKSVQNTR